MTRQNCRDFKNVNKIITVNVKILKTFNVTDDSDVPRCLTMPYEKYRISKNIGINKYMHLIHNVIHNYFMNHKSKNYMTSIWATLNYNHCITNIH